MDSAQQFVKSMLSNNYKYNDGLTVKFAYDLTLDSNLEELIKLDKECHALKAPREVREGSQKLGTRLIKIYGQLLGDPFLESIYELIVKKELQGHYAVIYGIITALLKIERDEAVCAFLYNATVSMVTNAVKLVPLGQSDGQQIIFNMQEVIETLTLEILELEREMYGVCNPALDIKCMQHEHLYSRLYMS